MVLWNYATTVYVNGLKQECEPSTSQGPAITNIAGTGGITCSGRVYGPEKQNKDDIVVKDRGKALVETSEEQEPPSKNFTDLEA